MTVADLKSLLKEKKLPVSGNKAELIKRLQEFDNVEEEILEAEVIGVEFHEENESSFDLIELMKRPVWNAINVGQISAVALVLLLITSALIVNPSLFGVGNKDYQLIDFDAQSTQNFAQALVDLGHPECQVQQKK